jgi:hypothetical protein
VDLGFQLIEAEASLSRPFVGLSIPAHVGTESCMRQIGHVRGRTDPGNPQGSIRHAARAYRALLVASSGTMLSVLTIFTLPHPLRKRQLLRLGVATHPVQRFRPIHYWKKFQ